MKSFQTKQLKPLRHPLSFKAELNSGFTLLEVLITLGIFIFIAGLGLGIGIDTFARTSINDERDTALLLLSKARARSLNNINQSPHGFRVEGNNFVIYEVGGGEEETPFNNRFTITGETDFEFTQLSGTTAGGTITISDGFGSLDILINDEGGISW